MQVCFTLMVSLTVMLLLVPPALPRRQQRTKRAPEAAQHETQELVEAWARRLSTFDQTSGERMQEANSALQYDRVGEACALYEYVHRGLRGNPVSAGRQRADMIAERRYDLQNLS